jgi:hypothetical protein
LRGKARALSEPLVLAGDEDILVSANVGEEVALRNIRFRVFEISRSYSNSAGASDLTGLGDHQLQVYFVALGNVGKDGTDGVSNELWETIDIYMYPEAPIFRFLHEYALVLSRSFNDKSTLGCRISRLKQVLVLFLHTLIY